jgi:hypothetical protein
MPRLVHTRPDHDETLIARLAAGDLAEREAVDANALVAACPACAQLRADLRSIMAATAGLPAPRRTRDFRLTDADAARLRQSGWRRVLGRFGDPRLAFTKPLATGLVALGIAGLVLIAAPSLIPAIGSSGAAPAQAPLAAQATAGPAGFGSDSGGAAPGAGNVEPSFRAIQSAPPPLPAASTAPAASSEPAASAAPAASSEPAASGLPAASAGPSSAPPADLGVGGGTAAGSSPAPVVEGNPSVGKSTEPGSEQTEGPSALLLVSLALLVVGVGLFLLRWAARRTA